MSMPERDEFLTNTPLYENIKISKDNMNWLKNLWLDTIKIDGYCPSCGKSAIFTSRKSRVGGLKPGPSKKEEKSQKEKYKRFKKDHRTFVREFRCARDKKHRMVYQFVIKEKDEKEDQLIKVGQYPSPVDLQQLHNKEYREKVGEILDSKKAEEYKKAIMSYANDFGIGAFVYLRRIFERLISDTYYRNQGKLDMEEEEFLDKTMKEQIKSLKEYLPEIVNENKHLYNVLSKGVHELSKSECLEYFNTVKEAVEYIMDKMYSKLQNEKKRKRLEKEINKIHLDTAD